MAIDHAGQGIRVNAVCPNEVNTPMLRTGFARRGFDPDTAVAELGNFRRAAESVHISQPAFSRHIRSLEEWVGATLVDRGTHPVALTDAGKRFLPAVHDMLEHLQKLR